MNTRFARVLSLPALIAAAGCGHALAQQYTATLFNTGVPEAFLFASAGGRQVGSVSTESGGHAALWLSQTTLPVDLNPANASGSVANGCGGLQQVGAVEIDDLTLAALWTGTASSFVSLAPDEFGYSAANATDGVRQVGSGRGPQTGRGPHALAWSGTAASVVDIHPDGYTFSVAEDVDAGRAVGWATDSFDMRNAGLWTTLSGASWVPLHPALGFDESAATAISGDQIVGYGNGTDTFGAPHALLWTDSGATLTDIHPPTYSGSYLYAAGAGRQAGSVIFGEVQERAAVWNGSWDSAIDLHDLIPDGPWESSRVTAIDGDGNLYGYATNAGLSVPVRWSPPATVCGPSDVGGAGGAPGPDGSLDNNDFVVFIDQFFNHAAAADVGTTGGLPGADGLFDNNDFVVFIDRFFAGC